MYLVVVTSTTDSSETRIRSIIHVDGVMYVLVFRRGQEEEPPLAQVDTATLGHSAVLLVV